MDSKSFYFKLALSAQSKMMVPFKRQLQQQQLLLDIARQALPDALKDHAKFCVINNGKLLIYTDNAVWASQLRFYTSGMLSALLAWRQNHFIELVQVRILKGDQAYSPSIRRANIPAATIIEQIAKARSSEKDNLSQALSNLSLTMQRHKQKT